MKFSESLKKNRDFQAVYKKRTSKANKYLVMYVKPNETQTNRVGISASRKVGNSVVRHRLTRLVREGYRLQEDLFKKGYDLVFVVRVNAKDCAYHTIERAIYRLAEAHGLLEEEKRIL